jgi:hypothetical protein
MVCLGALCYADDLTLLAPTAYAMRVMQNICDEYASEHDIPFNANKANVFYSNLMALQCTIGLLFTLAIN